MGLYCFHSCFPWYHHVPSRPQKPAYALVSCSSFWFDGRASFPSSKCLSLPSSFLPNPNICPLSTQALRQAGGSWAYTNVSSNYGKQTPCEGPNGLEPLSTSSSEPTSLLTLAPASGSRGQHLSASKFVRTVQVLGVSKP